MKKRIVSLLLLISILFSFSPAISSYASLSTTHTHYVCTRVGNYEQEYLYTHSHYCTKNGRTDWWPCLVYDQYKRIERYCVDCGVVIESLCYREYVGQIHQLAY
jgi:hypothetical protein